MIDQRTGPYGILLLRVTMGVMLLAHAYLKAVVFGLAGSGKFFVSLGLPDWLAVPTIALEFIGGLALILGIYARWISVPLCIELLATIVIAHGGNGWFFMNKGSGWEFPALWAAALAAVILLGDDAMALVRSPGFRNSKS